MRRALPNAGPGARSRPRALYANFGRRRESAQFEEEAKLRRQSLRRHIPDVRGFPPGLGRKKHGARASIGRRPLGPKGSPGENRDIAHPGPEFAKERGPFFNRTRAILVQSCSPVPRFKYI